MKLKKLILISILLLAILTVGSVNASENINQTYDTNLSYIDDISNGYDSNPISHKLDANVTIVDEPQVIMKGDSDNVMYVDVATSTIPNGNIMISVNGTDIYNQPAGSYNEIPYSAITKSLGNKFGLYDITLGYFNDTFYNDYSKSWKFNYTYYNLNIPSTINKDDGLSFYFSPDVAGKVTLTVDSKKVSTETIDEGFVYFDLSNKKLGKHTYTVKFESSKNTNVYKSFTKNGSLELQYQFDVEMVNDRIFLGDEAYLEIYLPWDASNKVNISYNNRSKIYKLDDEGILFAKLSDLDFGENKIKISYLGDKNYPAKSKDVTVTVNEILNIKSDAGYQSGEGIYLKLPSDAKGTLEVKIDGSTNYYPIENGIANISLSNYSMGHHDIYVNYTGDDYVIKGYNGLFDVVPNFIYSRNVYYKEGFNVTLELPEDANGTLVVSHDYRYEIANVVNGKASVLFDDIEISEDLDFKVEYVNGNYDSYSENLLINSRENPKDISFYVDIPKPVLIDDYEDIAVYMSAYSEGHVNVTVDEKFIGTHYVEENQIRVSLADLGKNLTIGNHTIKFDYSGDDYYSPQTKVTSFNVDFYRIFLKNEIILDENSHINIELSEDATGTAVLNIAGKTIKAKVSDDEGESKWISFDLSNIAYGEYEAKLVYSGDAKYGSFTKVFPINLTYIAEVDMNDENYYGENVELNFVFSLNPLNNITITVDDKVFINYVDNNELNITVENLSIGKHNITMDFPQGNTYPAKTFNWTFDVVPNIKFPEYLNIFDGGNVTLSLPEDANGSLNVEIYDKGNLINSYVNKLVKGIATINVNGLKLGYYQIVAKYDGNDYNVKKINSKFMVTPKIDYTDELYVDQNGEFKLKLPEDANGTLFIYLNQKKLDVEFKNGIFVVEIPPLGYTDDTDYINVEYFNDDKYGSYFDYFHYYIHAKRYNATINVVPQDEIIANNYITLTFTMPSDAKGYIMTNYGYVDLKNGQGVIKEFIKKAGVNSIYYYYSGDEKYEECSYEFNVTALPAPKLTMSPVKVFYKSTATFKVKVLDSYRKIVSGKYVTFYVNGKKVKSVKTDKKGYATFKLTKKPGKYNVKATYKGGVVTKKLTVKHLVTLKNVKLKKSARKLVLKVIVKGKKAIKYKKITFKFNGKKYTAYTNKNGVAKVTVKKATLKKLKVGKTVTYQATYLKDTVKISTKVLK